MRKCRHFLQIIIIVTEDAETSAFDLEVLRAELSSIKGVDEKRKETAPAIYFEIEKYLGC